MATPAMLSGHHAVVTGAGRGIGAAIAAQLAAQGATLTLMGRDVNVLQATAKTLSDSARAQVVTCDVTDEASVAAAFESARAGLGPIFTRALDYRGDVYHRILLAIPVAARRA